ncbi:hypothetical protein ACFU53_32500 [Streptomyces sp. NPDC057474]|uniref:hypothetical protein n=1 Tax=Streptomyces sp. NPDC057474 TaxID=3346144 RepID=UPI0036AC7D5A
MKEGAPATPDCTGRQGYPRPAPEGIDAHWAVHAAFAGGRPDVRVWFSDDEVVGLVITG